jgi:hypothetical protein
MKVTINNPNPYNSKNTGTAMVSYVVTGDKASVEQYRQDQLANGITSQDDNGNPLIHFTAKAALKYSAVAELERAETKEGNIIWFTDNEEDKQMSKLIAGADDQQSNSVSFRYRSGEQVNGVAVDKAVALILEAIESKKQV